jgi:hypothetical protein
MNSAILLDLEDTIKSEINETVFQHQTLEALNPNFPNRHKSQGLEQAIRGGVASIGRDGYLAMESSKPFYKAMVAFCRQHAKMQGEDESFWLDEAQTWADRLKAKNAFWHQFAGKPELPAKYDGASTSDRQRRIIDRE